jgi:hypothetical protein
MSDLTNEHISTLEKYIKSGGLASARDLLPEIDALIAEIRRRRAETATSTGVVETLQKQRERSRKFESGLTADERAQLEHHIRDHRATCSWSCSIIERLMTAADFRPGIEAILADDDLTSGEVRSRLRDLLGMP